jgi:glycosyltransferase involved in cell wall biosynthesis
VPERPYLSLILPAYNEVQRIAQTVGEAQLYLGGRGFSHEIIVAADGDDGTREKVAEMAQADPTLHVMGSAQRRGKGYGIRQAVLQASGQIIGFADADNKTPVNDFDQLDPWLRKGYDVVVGSRGMRQSRIERAQPLYRRWGSKAFTFFMHAMIGLSDIRDTQCGFKFFQRAVALDLFSRQRINGYMFDVEILYLAERGGYRIAQVPVRWRDDADSRFGVGEAVEDTLDILRIRWWAWRTPRQLMIPKESP